jgi:hypothetical protein
MAVVEADYIKVLMDCLCSDGNIDFKAQVYYTFQLTTPTPFFI